MKTWSKIAMMVLGLSAWSVLALAEAPPLAGATPAPAAFGHVGLATADVTKAARWYRSVLGFETLGQPTVIDTETSPLGEVARRLFGRDVRRLRIVQLRAGSGVGIELFEFLEPRAAVRQPGDSRRVGFLHMALVAGDVDAVVKKVVDNGGSIVVVGRPDPRKRVVFCTDPDGNVIEIASAKWAGM